MPINNEGRLLLSEVLAKQVDTNWPAANTDYELFIKDLIASGNVRANGLIIRNIQVSDDILTGNIVATSISANTLVLDILTSNTGIFENLTVNGDLTVEGNTVTLNAATLIIEDKNIVLANGAPDAATADGAGITIEGAGANITYSETGDKFVINKNLDVEGDVTANVLYINEIIATGNITANGITIRGIEVSDAVLSGNITAEGGISGNTIVVESITANVWNNLYTSNVIETSGNLYFTVPRARDSFSAGQNITIVEGVISAIQQLTVTNDNTVLETQANTLTYNMGKAIADPRNILVIVEGLIQIPSVDYTVSGTNLIFLDQPPPGTNIEVRFFGTEGSTGTLPTLISIVNSFVSSGNVEYPLTITPPGKDYVTVVVDGVTQQSESYTLTGSILTLSEAANVGSNIDVRIISGQAARPFTTRTYIGDGANTNFLVSTGYSADNILVFENGVAQIPITDYTYDDGTIIFNSPPASNVVIQIRELGTSGPNLLAVIRGADQTTGNLIPDVDGIRNLGSPNVRYKDLYLTGNTIFLGDIVLTSLNGILQTSPFISGNIITANSKPTVLTAGDNITIEANGRISSNSLIAGDNITIEANGRISSVATTGKSIAMAIVFGG